MTDTRDRSIPVEVPTLVAADRCDFCGAQAYVITMHEAGPLLWCGHHYTLALSNLPIPLLDKREQINSKTESPGEENS